MGHDFLNFFLETTFFSEVKAIKSFESQLRRLIKFCLNKFSIVILFQMRGRGTS